MYTNAEDRRVVQRDLPEGLIRRHDASSLVQAALVMQREAGIEKAYDFLRRSGLSDEVATRVLDKGLVREQDLSY